MDKLWTEWSKDNLADELGEISWKLWVEDPNPLQLLRIHVSKITKITKFETKYLWKCAKRTKSAKIVGRYEKHTRIRKCAKCAKNAENAKNAKITKK